MVQVIVGDLVHNLLSVTLECRDALMLLARVGVVGVSC